MTSTSSLPRGVTTIIVDNRIRIPEIGLDPEVAEALQEKFVRKNPMFWKLRKMGRRAWSEPAEVKCWKREGSQLTFPRGAWSIVKEILVRCEVPYRVEDRRERGEKAEKLTHFVETRDYQDEQLAQALRRENCILRASTGAGKTTIGLAVAAAVETWSLILVDDGGIANEWVRRAKQELDFDAGFIGDGRKSLRRITVALHQSIHAMKRDPEAFSDLRRRFGCVIVDEVQVLGAKTYGDNVDRMPARYRIGLSDDHHRADGKTFLVTDLMGPVAHKIGDKKLLEKNAIAPIDVIADATDFEAPWYANRPLDDDGDPIPPTGEEFTQLVAEMVADDARTARIALRIADRIAKARGSGKEMRFLVFSHRVEHCVKLVKYLNASGVHSGLMLGGDPEFERTREGLLSGKVKAGVGTLKALGKGVNVPDVDGGYATTPIVTSSQTWRQAVGRVRRPKDGGGSAEFWVSWDRKVFGDAPIRKLAKWHRDRVRIAVGSDLFTPLEYAQIAKGKNDDSASRKAKNVKRSASG